MRVNDSKEKPETEKTAQDPLEQQFHDMVKAKQAAVAKETAHGSRRAPPMESFKEDTPREAQASLGTHTPWKDHGAHGSGPAPIAEALPASLAAIVTQLERATNRQARWKARESLKELILGKLRALGDQQCHESQPGLVADAVVSGEFPIERVHQALDATAALMNNGKAKKAAGAVFHGCLAKRGFDWNAARQRAPPASK